ncbi:hypothetical protein [Candidatus Amarolinea dominans]|uniref:hypothetical protein n=1 Tax=Candidatus Amarolinea dominans TaxID=3140696 RepID=UPI0031CC478D
MPTPAGSSASRIAAWNGTSWSALGSGMDATVSALIVKGDGTLYSGGWFTAAGGSSASRIARWNGAAWSALGSAAPESITPSPRLRWTRTVISSSAAISPAPAV